VLIPARGGSKRIPNKNTYLLAGKPLIAHSIEHAKMSHLVSRIVVSTDDEQISRVSKKYGAEVITRPKHLANESASSESALLHALNYLKEVENYTPDLVVFLQCTSPVRNEYDIDNAITLFFEKNADSLFSACKNDKLIWAANANGHLIPLNYDYKARKREQDMEAQYQENGSIYIFRPSILVNLNNRLGGKIVAYEMDYWSSFQIDTLADVELINWIIRKQNTKTRVIK
jgi:N-acylneuraminate cytidylyltransferase